MINEIYISYFKEIYILHLLTAPLTMMYSKFISYLFIYSIGSLGADHSADYVSDVLINRARLSGTTNGVRIKTWQVRSGQWIIICIFLARLLTCLIVHFFPCMIPLAIGFKLLDGTSCIYFNSPALQNRKRGDKEGIICF